MSHHTNLDAPEFTRRFVNLADERLGAEAIFATDDFFADKQRMLQTADAIFYPDKYDDNGKWMDGWESRRKRVEGHDYCVVRLATSGRIYGVDIDTSHFTGNFPPAASLEACYCPDGDPAEDTTWIEIVAPIGLRAGVIMLTSRQRAFSPMSACISIPMEALPVCAFMAARIGTGQKWQAVPIRLIWQP